MRAPPSSRAGCRCRHPWSFRHDNGRNRRGCDAASAGRLRRSPTAPAPVRVQGKFFFAGEQEALRQRRHLRPFPKGSHGAQFPEHAVGRYRFRADGRSRHQHRAGLYGAAGLAARRCAASRSEGSGRTCRGRSTSPFSTARHPAQIRAAVAAGVRACRRHPAVFAYLVGNEIPPDMVRWHGAEAVRSFLKKPRRAAPRPSTRRRSSATPISRRPNI